MSTLGLYSNLAIAGPAGYIGSRVGCVAYAAVRECVWIVIILPIVAYFRDLNLTLAPSVHGDLLNGLFKRAARVKDLPRSIRWKMRGSRPPGRYKSVYIYSICAV